MIECTTTNCTGCDYLRTLGRELNMLQIMRTVVKSQNVRSIGYDKRSQTIQVQFHDGSIYEYYRRSVGVFRDFELSGSKGSFVAHRLTPNGNYKKVA